MAYTEKLPKLQSLIWQEDGDNTDAIRVIPEAGGMLTWITLQQRDSRVCMNSEGAKAVIKELQWFIKNKAEVIKECN